jgi:putative Holliday junction resolvase
MKEQRAVGLDVGTKTIGVALSDPLGMLAHPMTTVRRQGVTKDVAALCELLDGKGVCRVVVGLPYELDGTEERSARLALGVPVTYIDERFTSVEAERQLISAGMRRKKRKAVIDQQAAVLILQSWLDHGESLAE